MGRRLYSPSINTLHQVISQWTPLPGLHVSCQSKYCDHQYQKCILVHLNLYRVARTFGHISGFKVDHHFDSRCLLNSDSLHTWLLIHCPISREALVRSGVHGSPRQGIHGDHERGAFSICLSGKYEDDDDRGDTMYVASSILTLPSSHSRL